MRACRLCSLNKPSQNTQLEFLSSEVFIDYVGPIPRSKAGNSYLLVFDDVLSKFLWLFPLSSSKALSRHSGPISCSILVLILGGIPTLGLRIFHLNSPVYKLNHNLRDHTPKFKWTLLHY